MNFVSMVFMSIAFIAVRQRKLTLHRNMMLSAIASSVVFLVGYLIYHFGYDAKSYSGSIPTVYYTMLVSHIILAALVPFGVVYVVVQALRSKFTLHRKVARWVLPIWAYVSFTGVLVYFMIHT